MRLLPKPDRRTRPRIAPTAALAGLLVACSPPPEGVGRAAPPGDTDTAAARAGAVDDGTYLARIDPLGGQWRVERVGDEDFTPFGAWINFSAGGFLNHGAGCSGGYPAFYRLDGDRVALTRTEPVRTGKCDGFTGPDRARAVASELRLAGFLDGLSVWARPDDRTLVLTDGRGTRALLTRPVEPHPELAGRWLIETIGGQSLVTERRPAVLSFSMGGIGAHGDCNSMGATYAIPGPGRVAVSGPVVSTAIGCPPEDAAEDSLMARAMTGATGWRIDGDRLVLTGGPGLTARRPPPPDRRLVGDYRACGDTLLGAMHEGPVTLAIDERTMRDASGCRADYVANGPQLTVTPDRAVCTGSPTPYVPGRPIGLGGAISVLATAPPDGFGFDEGGRLLLRTGRGLLGMCRVGAPPEFGQ